MIRATRRAALAAALAMPAAAAIAKAPKRGASGTIVLYDPSFQGARSFAVSAKVRGAEAVRIEGDRIRFSRALFARKPALVVGVSRSADTVLIEDVGREAGYVTVPVPAAIARLMHSQSARPWALAPRD
jgi:hypothetical protein